MKFVLDGKDVFLRIMREHKEAVSGRERFQSLMCVFDVERCYKAKDSYLHCSGCTLYSWCGIRENMWFLK